MTFDWNTDKGFKIVPGDGLVSEELTDVTLPIVINPLRNLDPYWGNVVLALPMDGVNGSTVFTDISPTPKTITKYGDAKISTTQSKFGGASAYFDGTGDYLKSAVSSDFNFGSGDWTIGCFFYAESLTNANAIIFSIIDGSGNYELKLIVNSSGYLRFNIYYSAAYQINYTCSISPISAGTLHHIEVVHLGENNYIFLDGAIVGTIVKALSFPSVNWFFTVGGISYGDSTFFFKGFIDDVLVTKGVARHTANFTPPIRSIKETIAAHAGSGLTLLDTDALFDDLNMVDPYWGNVVLALPMDGVNGSTVFTDISPTPKTITKYGDAKISTTQSKFGGASAYFDGTGDYLSISAVSALGTGDFTVECWFWLVSSSIGSMLFDCRTTDLDANGFAFYPRASNKLTFGRGNPFVATEGTTTITTGVWHYATLTRLGTTIYAFLDGILEFTVTGISTNFTNILHRLGQGPVLYTLSPIYIDDLRITKGVARYIANFTPPTRSISTTTPTSDPIFNKKIALYSGDTECPLQITPDGWDAVNKSALLLATIPDLTSSTELNFYYDIDHEDNSNVTDVDPMPDAPTDPDVLALYNLALSDELWIWDNLVVVQIVSIILDQPVALLHLVMMALDQPVAFPNRMILDQPCKDSATVSMILDQWVRDLQTVKMVLDQPCGTAKTVRMILDQPVRFSAQVTMILDQPVTLGGQLVTMIIDQPVSLLVTSGRVSMILDQPCSIASDNTIVQRIALSVTVGGKVVDPDYISVRADDQDGYITSTIRLPDYAQYSAISIGDDVIITESVNDGAPETTKLMVDSLTSSENPGLSDHTITATSPTQVLDEVLLSEDLGPGIADVLLTDLCARYGVDLDWQGVANWPILSGELLANDETPFAILQNIAAVSGAFLQSLPDGSLRLRQDYQTSVADWPAATEFDLEIDEQDHIFSIDEQADPRDGYNAFLISGESASSDQYRLVADDISDTVKEIRCYVVPWDEQADIVLGHTGGDWVSIDTLNTASAPYYYYIEKEEVEIVAGMGSTDYPVDALILAEYKQDSLGDVTADFDGSISTEIVGDALLEVSYWTICLRWRVTDPRAESLQLFIDEVA